MAAETNYLSGFGNHHATESLSGALPQGQNSPQKPAYGLYAEQLSGTSFTAPRSENLRSWLYRILPSVGHGQFKQTPVKHWTTGTLKDIAPTPEQLRWSPIPEASRDTDFLNGVHTFATNGSPAERTGCGVHLYAFKKSDPNVFFYNADGELLFVPQKADHVFHTELGELKVKPGEIAVIPRGIRFRISTEKDAEARGYLCENYGQPFRLPGLGPIGANGLANPRDFLAPRAKFDDKKAKFEITGKYQGHFWKIEQPHSPCDVVAWHGNYFPYKYDLAKFNTIGTVSFDHPDPSIFTVLTSPSALPGTANVDFVIFPPRWMVAENTFRPPYYHRNVMSEFMGLVHGVYDAKPDGFANGGASLHNAMSAHGPDAAAFKKATEAKLEPQYYEKTLAIMFESSLPFNPTAYALECSERQKDYLKCWEGLVPAQLK